MAETTKTTATCNAMDDHDRPNSRQSSHGGDGEDAISGPSVPFNDGPTLPFSFSSVEQSHNEDATENGENGEANDGNAPLPVSPLSTVPEDPPSLSVSSEGPSETHFPKMKVTMSFMKAYKAMRGPRDVEPSPLFGCFVKPARNGISVEDDQSKLAGREEVRFSHFWTTKLPGDIFHSVLC